MRPHRLGRSSVRVTELSYGAAGIGDLRFVRETDIDVVLLAGRHTLPDRSGLLPGDVPVPGPTGSRPCA